MKYEQIVAATAATKNILDSAKAIMEDHDLESMVWEAKQEWVEAHRGELKDEIENAFKAWADDVDFSDLPAGVDREAVVAVLRAALSKIEVNPDLF